MIRDLNKGVCFDAVAYPVSLSRGKKRNKYSDTFERSTDDTTDESLVQPTEPHFELCFHIERLIIRFPLFALSLLYICFLRVER